MDERPCKGCGGEKLSGKGYRYCQACIDKRDKKLGCVKCGAPKIPGMGHIYCEECSQLQKWAIEKRRGFKPKRLCKKCKKVWVSGLKQNCEACRSTVAVCYNCKTRPIRGFHKQLCEPCYQESRKQKNKYRSAWRSKQREDPVKAQKMRDYDRARRARLKQDPEWVKQQNETRRLWWRRIHGTKPLTEEEYEKGVGKSKIRLPSAPLKMAIEEYLSKGNSILSIAHEGNVQEKRVGEVYRGAVDTVRIDIADKICVACGTTLEWVYDEAVVRGEIPRDGDYDLDKAL